MVVSKGWGRTPSWGDLGTHITSKFEFLTPGQVVTKQFQTTVMIYLTIFSERSRAGQMV